MIIAFYRKNPIGDYRPGPSPVQPALCPYTSALLPVGAENGTAVALLVPPPGSNRLDRGSALGLNRSGSIATGARNSAHPDRDNGIKLATILTYLICILIAQNFYSIFLGTGKDIALLSILVGFVLYWVFAFAYAVCVLLGRRALGLKSPR